MSNPTQSRAVAEARVRLHAACSGKPGVKIAVRPEDVQTLLNHAWAETQRADVAEAKLESLSKPEVTTPPSPAAPKPLWSGNRFAISNPKSE